MSEEKLYYVLRWTKPRQPNFPKYEVRPMPEDRANDYTIVESNLPFPVANKKRKALEEKT